MEINNKNIIHFPLYIHLNTLIVSCTSYKKDENDDIEFEIVHNNEQQYWVKFGRSFSSNEGVQNGSFGNKRIQFDELLDFK